MEEVDFTPVEPCPPPPERDGKDLMIDQLTSQVSQLEMVVETVNERYLETLNENLQLRIQAKMLGKGIANATNIA